MRTHPLLAPALLTALLALSGCGGRHESGHDALPAVVWGPGHAATEAPLPEPAIGAAVDTALLAGEHNTEEYDRIRENEFRDVALNPLSTFAIDVDPASYSNVRRFLSEGRLPPPDAVRIEELVNYFDYDYPDPSGEHPFSVITEVSAAPWNPAHRLVHIGIQGKRMNAAEMPPSNLVFLVDGSGSMESPDKLPLVKQSLRMLVEQLRPRDRVALVVYAGSAGLVLPSTPGSEKRTILEAIDRLEAGGSTAGGEGIRLAYRVAREGQIRGGNNRVILATDGDFNVGVSSDAELVRLIEEEREHGVFLTVLGFGTGNLKDSKLEQLADHGNGNYAYVDGVQEARKVLVGEMGGTLLTIARDVKVQVEFNPARVRAYRLIGYENRLLAAEDFNDDRKDAGELGAGHSVTALYEVVPVGAATAVRGVDPLRYQEVRARSQASGSGELMTVKLRYKEPEGDMSRLITHPVPDRQVAPEAASADFRFAAAVAEWGLLLRGSRFRGQASHEQVLSLARGALGEDRSGYREEFVRLVQSSRRLAAGGSSGGIEHTGGH
ncbi:MAG TPA: VWA domain-containing protein [Longimicrobiaceae bacterium]|nr:VWA domain-containing protein [Longimicrobiaceae bacterium]